MNSATMTRRVFRTALRFADKAFWNLLAFILGYAGTTFAAFALTDAVRSFAA